MRALILESLAPVGEHPEPLRLVDVADPVQCGAMNVRPDFRRASRD